MSNWEGTQAAWGSTHPLTTVLPYFQGAGRSHSLFQILRGGEKAPKPSPGPRHGADRGGGGGGTPEQPRWLTDPREGLFLGPPLPPLGDPPAAVPSRHQPETLVSYVHKNKAREPW